MRRLRLFALIGTTLFLEAFVLAGVLVVAAVAGRPALIGACAGAAVVTLLLVLWARREWRQIEIRYWDL